MAEMNKDALVENVAAQVETLNDIGKSFGAFAAALKDRHAELQNSVPKIEDAVVSVQKVVLDAVARSEKAAAAIASAADRLTNDSDGKFADWQKEAAKAREGIEGLVGDLGTNIKAVQDALVGIREAVGELKEIENKVFPGIKESFESVKDSVERNTKAKIGDFAGALPTPSAVPTEDIQKLRDEIADLKRSLESAKDELLAAKKDPAPLQTDTVEAESYNSGVVADELSELKSMMFEMVRFMKEVADRKIEPPKVEIKAPEPPPPGSPEDLAERMASGYRDLVKLMTDKKN